MLHDSTQSMKKVAGMNAWKTFRLFAFMKYKHCFTHNEQIPTSRPRIQIADSSALTAAIWSVQVLAKAMCFRPIVY